MFVFSPSKLLLLLLLDNQLKYHHITLITVFNFEVKYLDFVNNKIIIIIIIFWLWLDKKKIDKLKQIFVYYSISYLKKNKIKILNFWTSNKLDLTFIFDTKQGEKINNRRLQTWDKRGTLINRTEARRGEEKIERSNASHKLSIVYFNSLFFLKIR